MMYENKSARHIAATVLLILVSVGQLIPLIWLLDFSLAKSGDLFGANMFILPNPPQWNNYVRAWVDGHIPLYFVNSLIVNAVSIGLVAFFSVTMAYAFKRMHWHLRGALLALVTIGIMVPIHATLLPNFIIFNATKIADTYLGLIIPYTAFGLPMGTFIMTGFMDTVPLSLEESAILDGCNMWQLLFRIVFPIVRPAIVTVVIMTYISTWNEFIMAATFLNNDKLRTLPYAVYNFAGQYSADYAIQFAVMMLVALPSLLVYAFLSDKITAGATEGALKG